jgi:hypothetical protein
VSQLTKKNIVIMQKKIVDRLKICMVYYKVYEADFWWQVMKIHIIYCMAFVAMAAFRIRLEVTRVSIRKELRGLASTIVLSNNTENPGVLAVPLCSSILMLLPYSGKQDVSRFFGLQSSLVSAKDIFITKFHELMTIYKGVFSRLKDKRLAGRRQMQFTMNTCTNSNISFRRPSFKGGDFSNPRHRSCLSRWPGKILLQNEKKCCRIHKVCDILRVWSEIAVSIQRWVFTLWMRCEFGVG